MNNKTNITVIIPTLQKNIEVLIKLLEVLVKDTIIKEIIVIDNSRKGLNFISEKIRLITPDKNLYVNPSWNLGISESKTEYFALFNDDLLVCENFCSKVLDLIKNKDDFGILGMGEGTVTNTKDIFIPNQTDFFIQKNDVYERPYNWGVIIFGKKSITPKIPENLKIMCGDDFLRYSVRKNKFSVYDLFNTEVEHLGSISSQSSEFLKIGQKEILEYAKIDKNFVNTHSYNWAKSELSPWKKLQNIFSIKNSDDKKHKVITLLGLKFKFKSKKLMKKQGLPCNSLWENIFSLKNSGVHKVINILGIKFKIKSKRLEKKRVEQEKLRQERIINEYGKLLENKRVIICFDHSLGGGTETYFYNKLYELPEGSILLRIQYYLNNQRYKITFYDNDKKYELDAIDFVFLDKFINCIKIFKIILNNIVGYPEVKKILELIKTCKINNPQAKVIIKGHDFYSICPEWNLLNSNDEYCNICCTESECQKCYYKFQLKAKDIQNNFSILKWRRMWGEFLSSTVDELEVFSASSCEIFSIAYPQIACKIVVNPHKIKPFPKYNIAVLGNLQLVKGAKIVENLVSYLEKNQNFDYQLYLIGQKYRNIDSDLITVKGTYKRNDLPNILKNNNIDLILIPSIWHETFSYTTAESIALGYSVACFDMGGQAEQVRQYNKGLILSSFEPEIIEKEIREFLENKEVRYEVV